MKSLQTNDTVIFAALCGLVFFVPVSIALVGILSAFLALLFIVKNWRRGSRPLSFVLPAWVIIPLLLFVIWSALSVSWSQWPYQSARGFLGKTMKGIILLLVAYDVLNARHRFRRGLVFLLAGVGAMCLEGLWQSFFKQGLFSRPMIIDGRITAMFKHPNDFAAYLLFSILPVMALGYMAFRSSCQALTMVNITQAAWRLVFMCVVLANFGLTYSRGAWMGAVAACLIFVCFVRRSWLFVLACVTIFGLVFMPMMVEDRQTSIISDSISDPRAIGGNGRLGFWRDAMRIIYDHPILGTGLNTYTKVIKEYAEVWKAYPHNCYLHMCAELGVVGLTLFLWFLGAVGVFVTRRIWGLPDSPDRTLLAACFAGWCGVLLHSALDTTLYSSQLSALFWVMTGALLAFGRSSECCADGKNPGV